MIRVVVDPGVLVSALLTPNGASAALFLAWREGKLEIVVSPLLLGELRTVLARPKFRSYVTQTEADAYIEILRREAHTIADPDAVMGVTPDPNDDYLVALAHEAEARFLISGDAHLTGMEHLDPPVLTPRQLVDRLSRG